VKQKLTDAKINMDFTPEQTSYIERLGGRASDLESVCYLKHFDAVVLTAYSTIFPSLSTKFVVANASRMLWRILSIEKSVN
jgi:hypothetical protein